MQKSFSSERFLKCMSIFGISLFGSKHVLVATRERHFEENTLKVVALKRVSG